MLRSFPVTLSLSAWLAAAVLPAWAGQAAPAQAQPPDVVVQPRLLIPPGAPGQPSPRVGRLLTPADGTTVVRKDVLLAAPLSPEMARKTAAILALRSMLQMGLSGPDLEKALASLKEIQAAQQELQKEAGQALEEERQALLAAKPGSQPPPGSGKKLAQATQRFRERQQKVWDELAKAIGPEKTAGVRRLISDGSATAVHVVVSENHVVGPGTADHAFTLRTVPGAGGPAVYRAQNRVVEKLPAPSRGSAVLVEAAGLPLADLIDLFSQKIEAIR